MEVLEQMLVNHHNIDHEKDQEFIKKVFGVAKPSASKPTKIHEVTRAKRTQNKRRYVDFYNLTGLLDYYEDTRVIDKDDLVHHYSVISNHLRQNNFQENDIIFIGSVHEERQWCEGFALVTKHKGASGFRLGKTPDDLLNGKKMYYCQAVEAMNVFWNEMFGEDVISQETICDLSVNDMYDH